MNRREFARLLLGALAAASTPRLLSGARSYDGPSAFMYDRARAAFMRGELMPWDEMTALLVVGEPGTEESKSDLRGSIVAEVPLKGVVAKPGRVEAEDVTFDSIPVGCIVDRVVLAIGEELIGSIGAAPNRYSLPVHCNGGDITVVWGRRGVFEL